MPSQAAALGLKAWPEITLEQLQEEGTPDQDDYLLYRDEDRVEGSKHAPFLVYTREGSPLLLFVGVPVYHAEFKPGAIIEGDLELRTTGLRLE